MGGPMGPIFNGGPMGPPPCNGGPGFRAARAGALLGGCGLKKINFLEESIFLNNFSSRIGPRHSRMAILTSGSI